MAPQLQCALGGVAVPVHRLNTVILGAGAAGMNCAVHLCEFLAAKGVKDAQDRIAVVTAGRGLGASRMSGSDKQTYYKTGLDPATPDCAMDFAEALTRSGCMHGDIALVEAANSLREFFHLVQAGVPFPHDPEGAYVGYKTDHDPRARATSAGPRTSRFMSECLEAQARRHGIRIHDRHEALHLLTEDGAERRIVGLVTLDRRRLNEDGFGLTVFLAENVVLAAGGPGALFDVSVYPEGQVGIHGLALKAGLRAANMTEWQFGLASTPFRWNVSGTYMQAIPRLVSTNRKGGDARDFLCGRFPDTSALATAIFLKGYQWPFDAQRVTGHQSSFIDLLVTHETRGLGRRVFLDFRENPRPAPGMKPFDLRDLATEARAYLEKTGAVQATPIERLAQMNPPAIAVYAEHGIDLAREPLEVNVCAQHHNGGFVVDTWWQSSIPHTFAIGEMAGTHGVKRPGGAALNSGQVGGLRAAEYIAHVYGGDVASEALLCESSKRQLAQLLDRLRALCACDAEAMTAREAVRTIQCRSTATAAHLRDLESAERGLCESREMLISIRACGLRVVRRSDLIHAIEAEHMLLTQAAVLESLVDYLRRGGGSRGSFMVMDPRGVEIAPDLVCPWTRTPYRFLPENESLRNEIAEIALTNADRAEFAITHVSPRPIPRRDDAFETVWARFRSGEVFRG